MSTSTRSVSSASDSNFLRVATLKRVSSDKQTSGGGLDAQTRIIEEALNDIEEETSIEREIEEKGISGTKFPRSSLLELLAEAREGKLDALAVKDVSRIGRLAAPTFGFIWLLNHDFNIELIVEDGRYNIQRKSDLIQMFFRTLNAELKNRFRTSYVHESQLEEFRQGNFHVTGRHVRFGYKKVRNDEMEGELKGQIADGEEIEINQHEAEVVKTVFSELVDIGPARNAFSRIRDRVEAEFGRERIPGDNINLKDLLRNPIYKGTPTWEINAVTEGHKSATMNREDLQIVTDSTFEEVQKVLDTRDSRYTQAAPEKEDNLDGLTLQQIASIVGLSRLTAFEDVVRIHCPSCGEEMHDNGKWRATSDLKPSNIDDIADEPILKRYSCPNGNCERSEKRFPNEFEAYLLFDTDIPLDKLVNYAD
ncbi:recombinase family protein [Haloarcula marismortui]|uniref:Site-specific recombinase n=1 Tax=Haloarcula marismortui ATCC 33799 TaxID=662475 RepID=M0KR79_9EURY|nr:recombinase family protein [Haloarcula californiae]EMA23802.1 site-specific recombinase [Haloarcula californiae ATCC 33799]